MINQLSFNGSVNSAFKCNGRAYAVGVFTTVNGLPKPYFVEIDLTTGNPTSLTAPIDGVVSRAIPCGTKILLTGNFTKLYGVNTRGTIVIYDTVTGLFSDPLLAMGLYDVPSVAIGGAGAKSYLYDMAYHENSGYVYLSVGGAVSNDPLNSPSNSGSVIRKWNYSFNPHTLNLAPNSALFNSFRLYSFDFNQATDTMYYLGLRLPVSVGFPGSLNVADPNNVTAGTWSPDLSLITYIGALRVFYAQNKVFFCGTNSGAAASLINGTYHYGITPFDSTLGSVDTSMDWNTYKNAIAGEVRVNQITYTDNGYYVMGAFTDTVKQSTYTSGLQRPSLYIRKTDGSFGGDFIAFNGIRTVLYYSLQQSNQPSQIQAGIFDEGKLHLFGYIPIVDGVMLNNNHYILNDDGTKIQKRLAVFL